MHDQDRQLADEETMETAPVAPSNPEERAFTGHPDHPPATPDQPVEGNEELIRRPDDQPDSDASEAEAQPS